MDPLEGTFLKVNVDRPDFRTHIFNLVIRPSKAKQSVFSALHLLQCRAAPVVYVTLGYAHSC